MTRAGANPAAASAQKPRDPVLAIAPPAQQVDEREQRIHHDNAGWVSRAEKVGQGRDKRVDAGSLLDSELAGDGSEFGPGEQLVFLDVVDSHSVVAQAVAQTPREGRLADGRCDTGDRQERCHLGHCVG